MTRQDPPSHHARSPTFARPDFIGAGPPPVVASPARFTEDCAAIYERAVHALTDADVPFLVGGALALNRHTGIWRDTKDLDLFLAHDDLEHAMSVLERAGLETGEVYPSWLAKAWEGDIFVDLIHRGMNGEHPVTEPWFERATDVRLFDRNVPFVSPEDLIVSKIFVGNRVRFDGADVLHVLHVKGRELDWDLLTELTGRRHAGLLLAYLHMYRWAYPAFADRVPDAAMDRLTGLAREDEREAEVPFRGTLLDLVSFRVDVDAWGLPDPHHDMLQGLRDEWDVPPGEPFS